MKVLYLDLNADDLVEDYGLLSKRYGGGRIVASHLMPYLNDNGHYCEIWANPKCFDNVEEKYKSFCKGMSHAERLHYIKDGVIQGFDIVLHNFSREHVNTTGKSLVWLVGRNEWVSPKNEHVILYNDHQAPYFTNPNMKLHYARIGVPIPGFQEYKKEDFIFSCHRQAKEFGSELMMQLAHKHKLRYICSGPKDTNFPDMEKYIDNKYVTYLGVISEEVKVDYFKRAICSTYLHTWQTPMNLSACQSMTYGTPCIANNIGFWPSLIKNGVNGYLVHSEQEFLDALKNCVAIPQQSCYTSILDYSSDKMIEDYMRVFEKVLSA